MNQKMTQADKLAQYFTKEYIRVTNQYICWRRMIPKAQAYLDALDKHFINGSSNIKPKGFLNDQIQPNQKRRH